MFADLLNLKPAPVVGARIVRLEIPDELYKQYRRLETLKGLLARDIHDRRMATGREAYANASRKVKRTQTRIKDCQTRIENIEGEGKC